MNKQETLTWQSGASDDTPPPPMVDLRDLLDRDQLFLKQYRKLGPPSALATTPAWARASPKSS